MELDQADSILAHEETAEPVVETKAKKPLSEDQWPPPHITQSATSVRRPSPRPRLLTTP